MKTKKRSSSRRSGSKKSSSSKSGMSKSYKVAYKKAFSKSDSSKKKCPECKGKKKVLWLDADDRPVISPCYKCKGKGYIQIERIGQ